MGNVLADGDSVTITKELKVKGASSALKAGTKVRNIQLVEGDHNIDCKIDGFGPMKLKSEFVKRPSSLSYLGTQCIVRRDWRFIPAAVGRPDRADRSSSAAARRASCVAFGPRRQTPG